MREMKDLFSLKRCIYTGNIKVRLDMKIFDQMIKPILYHASELWSACKRAINLAVKGELGRFPVSFHVLYKLLNTDTIFRKLLTSSRSGFC